MGELVPFVRRPFDVPVHVRAGMEFEFLKMLRGPGKLHALEAPFKKQKLPVTLEQVRARHAEMLRNRERGMGLLAQDALRSYLEPAVGSFGWTVEPRCWSEDKAGLDIVCTRDNGRLTIQCKHTGWENPILGLKLRDRSADVVALLGGRHEEELCWIGWLPRHLFDLLCFPITYKDGTPAAAVPHWSLFMPHLFRALLRAHEGDPEFEGLCLWKATMGPLAVRATLREMADFGPQPTWKSMVNWAAVLEGVPSLEACRSSCASAMAEAMIEHLRQNGVVL